MSALGAEWWSPVENEALRLVLGPERRKLVKDIETWLPLAKRPGDRWFKGLEEMRRGLDIVAGAVEYLGASRPRLLIPRGIAPARAWLRVVLGPPHGGAHRPKDYDRVRAGVSLAACFEHQDERVTLGRQGLFAETFAVVLETLGYRAPADPLHLLRRIRAERAKEKRWEASRAAYRLFLWEERRLKAAWPRLLRASGRATRSETAGRPRSPGAPTPGRRAG